MTEKMTKNGIEEAVIGIQPIIDDIENNDSASKVLLDRLVNVKNELLQEHFELSRASVKAVRKPRKKKSDKKSPSTNPGDEKASSKTPS